MSRFKQKNCIVCGKDMGIVAVNRLRCPSCAKKQLNEIKKRVMTRPCPICGKLCYGKMCETCFKKSMREQRK